MADQDPAERAWEAVRGRARRTIIIGSVLAAGGLIISIATYAAAASNPQGGTYFVAYGPAIFGVLALYRGLRAWYAAGPRPTSTGAEVPTDSSQKNRSPSRRPLAITSVVVLAGVVGVIAVHALVAHNNSANDQAMGNWISSYGSTYRAVADDTGAVNNSTNAQSLRSACVKLHGEVTQAQADPPMPLSSLEQQWSTILSNLSASAGDCVQGIDQRSNNLMNTAQNDMNDAGKAYSRLVKAVQQDQ
jgi:hypothetical protein